MSSIKAAAARLAAAATVLAVLLAAGPPALAGSPPAAASRATRSAAPAGVRTLGLDAYLLTVTDLEASFAFYRDVVGLPVARPPGEPHAERAMQRLTDTPMALSRSAAFAIPGTPTRLLLEEFSRSDGRPQKPRAVDPGAATLVVSVQNLQLVLAAANRFGTPAVTRGGRPIDTPGGQSAIVLVDPDGFYVEATQSAAAAAGAHRPSGTGSNVLGAWMMFTVASPVTAVRFYRDVLGLRLSPDAFARTPSLEALIDVPGARPAATAVTADHGGGSLELVSFSGVRRHTYLFRPQDPGAHALLMRVANLADALRKVRAVGATVISAGGQPVALDDTQAIEIRGPDGLLLRLVGPSH